MNIIRKALLLLPLCAALAAPLYSQTPDCSFTFTFSGNATQTAVSNLSGNTPCVNWRVTFSVTGTLSSTVAFQTSPDNSTWTAVPNTVCSSSVQPPCVLQGVNPMVGTQGMLYAASYGAFVRVVTTSSSGTGTGTVRAYGAKGASASALPAGNGGGGGSGTVTNTGTLTADAIVTGNGGVDIKTPCATCTLSAAGDQTLAGGLSTGTGGGASGSVTLSGSTSGSATIQAAVAQGTPNPIQLPITNSAAGQTLISDGGNPQQLSWGAGGGGTALPAASNLTPVTVNGNTTTDQTLQEVALTAGFLNVLKAANIFHGSGRLTIAVAQTPTLTFKAKLCTVSGCGSGTVVTLATITSGATIAATNNGWNLQLMVGTSAIGATGNLWVHGAPGLTIDIGGLPGSAATPYTDTNTAVSANIDLTAALFVDFTVATSTGNAGNAITQDIAEVLPQGNGGGGGGSSVGPSASAINSGTQSIPTGTDTPLTFDTNQWDTGSIHSTSVNTDRFTAPTTGFYLAACGMILDGSSTPFLQLSIRINGPSIQGATQGIGIGGQSSAAYTVSQIIKLNAGDFMLCNLFSNSNTATLANLAFGQLTKLSSTF